MLLQSCRAAIKKRGTEQYPL